MKLKLAILFSLSGLFIVGASLLTRTEHNSIRTLPAKETAADVAVAKNDLDAPRMEANADWIITIDKAVSNDSADQLETLFRTPGLPATAKAHLIDAALVRQDSRLLRVAQDLVRRMVQSGSVADVLAAIPKVAYFSDDTLRDIALLQESLCRFQASPEDEFGFEMIKVKFAMVLGKEPSVKPWPAVCGAS